MQYIEPWGALGVFIASVIPFVDAIAMVPVGIALGVNPTLAVIAAVTGDMGSALIYLIGPIFGALVAVFVYDFVMKPSKSS